MVSERAWQLRALLTLAPLAVLVLYVETMVVPALPVIATEFGVSLAETSWILTIYLLTGAAAPPVIGRLGDIYGKKRVLLILLAAYNASLVASFLAPSLGALVATRAVQGFGFTMFPLAFGIIRDEYGPHRMAVAQGVISTMFGLGGALGLFVGSWITEQYGWRTTYESILPFGVLLFVAAWFLVRDTGAKQRVPIDYPGAALLMAAVLPLLYAIVRVDTWGGFGDARFWVFVGAGAFFAALFAWRMVAAKAPLMRMELLADRDILLTNVLGIGIGFGMFTLFQTLPGLIQTPQPVGFGGSVFLAGLTQLPMSLATLVSGPLNGFVVHRMGPKRPLSIGMFGVVAAFGSLVAFHDVLWHIMVAMALFGWAISMTMVASINLILIATPRTHLGVSSAMNQTFRITGGSLGPAVAAYFLAAYTQPLEFRGVTQALPTEFAYVVTFAVAGAVVLAGAVLSFFLTDRRPGEEVPTEVPSAVEEPSVAGGEG